jgi:hypothetical protein
MIQNETATSGCLSAWRRVLAAPTGRRLAQWDRKT